MEAIKCIMTRKSVRKYSGKEVSAKQLKTILECAMQAPSAVNEQPWEFVVVKDKALLEKLSKATLYSGMVKSSSVAIVVCMNEKKENMWAKKFYGGGFAVQDCSAAAQNILLSANAQGLGGVWVGAYPSEKIVSTIRELFEMPKHVIPLCIIPIGYPKEKPNAEKRYKEERVHKDKW